MLVGRTQYRGSVVVINIGVHDGFDAEYLAGNVYGPAIEDARNHGDARLICVLAPWVETARKPDKFKDSQGDTQVLSFNNRLRRFCDERGAEVFDMRAATFNMTSMDGMHRGLAANVLMGQLFLNFLAQGPWGWADANVGLADTDGFVL